MSAELPISPSIKDAQRDAINDINRWRGHCIELFARADHVVGTALARNEIARVPGSLAGRVDALKLVCKSARLSRTLDEFRDMIEHRNVLAHAVSAVWVKDAGNWLWSYRFTPAGKGNAEQRGYWCSDEAEDFEEKLRRTVQRLTSLLASERRLKQPEDPLTRV